MRVERYLTLNLTEVRLRQCKYCPTERRTTMETAGHHPQVERLDRKDVNGLCMVTCRVCDTTAHARSFEAAVIDLAVNASCSPGCTNCKSLRRSYDGRPAVPLGGSSSDRLHVCPNDGNWWWQTNSHFHHWKQVTENEEWAILNRPQMSSEFDDD